MKKYQITSSIIFALVVLQLLNISVFANSSWVWISETRPYDVLPWVAIGTLVIETLSIVFIAKYNKIFKVFTFVTVANLISFAMPYLINYIIYSMEHFPFEKYFEHWPSYTVGVLFCIATIVIELPVLYVTLKKDALSNKKLLSTIVVSNIITTVLVAIIERTICVGNWWFYDWNSNMVIIK